MGRQALTWFVVLGVAFHSARAAAEPVESPRKIVAIATDHNESRRVLSLRAELEALDFNTVIVTDPSALSSQLELHRLARVAGAVAAVLMLASSEEIEVLVLETPTRKALLHRLSAVDSEEAEFFVALHTAELLRAHLMGATGLEPPIPRQAEEPFPARRRRDIRAEHRLRHRFALEAAAGTLFAPGGISPGVQVKLSAGWSPLEWLELEAVALAPVYPASLENEEGKSEAWIGVLGAGTRVMLRREGKTLRPWLGAGLGVLYAHLQGRASAPYSSQSDSAFAAFPYLSGGLSLRLSPGIYAGFDLILGETLPRLVVDFVGRQVASWGTPVLGASLGLGVRLF